MDMADCTNEDVKYIYLCTENGPVECDFYGVWHDAKDCLRMEIVKRATGFVLAVGYGTDH